MNCKEFLLLRACCEKFRILFSYTVKPGGIYLVEVDSQQLELIGY